MTSFVGVLFVYLMIKMNTVESGDCFHSFMPFTLISFTPLVELKLNFIKLI